MTEWKLFMTTYERFIYQYMRGLTPVQIAIDEIGYDPSDVRHTMREGFKAMGFFSDMPPELFPWRGLSTQKCSWPRDKRAAVRDLIKTRVANRETKKRRHRRVRGR